MTALLGVAVVAGECEVLNAVVTTMVQSEDVFHSGVCFTVQFHYDLRVTEDALPDPHPRPL